MNRLLIRKFHTRIPNNKKSFLDYLVTFTLANSVIFSISNSFYFGYYNLIQHKESRFKKNQKIINDYGEEHYNTYHKYNNMIDEIPNQVFDFMYGATTGLITGSVLGIVWPVTYVVIGYNLYNKK